MLSMITEDRAVELIKSTDARAAAVTAETSRAVWTLVREHGWTPTRVARELGMSRPTVYSHLRWVDALDVKGADDA